MIQDTNPILAYSLGLENFSLFFQSTYIPTPKKKDYEYGWITRYFVGKRNQQMIIETNARDYNATDESFFVKGKLDWQISGRKNSLYKDQILLEAGVQENNLLQIGNLKKTLPGIEIVLSDPLQFWQGY